VGDAAAGEAAAGFGDAAAGFGEAFAVGDAFAFALRALRFCLFLIGAGPDFDSVSE
jgi:hypothetical protein